MSDRAHRGAITIIAPAYEEQENLRELLPRIRDAVKGRDFELLVILPGITSVADQREIEGLGGLPVIQPGNNYGDAIRTGFRSMSASSDLVVVMDADGSHDPATIPRLLDAVERAHVVVASRYVRGGGTDNSAVLKLMSWSLNFAYRVVLGIDCKDVSNSFKAYHADDLRAIELTRSDFDVVEEIIFRIKMRHGRNFVIEEIPDHFFERRHGETKRKLGPYILSYVRTLATLGWAGRIRVTQPASRAPNALR